MASEQQKQSMAETLLERPQIQTAPEDRKEAWPSLMTIIGSTFLTFNAAMAMSSWNRGFGAVSFVAFSYVDLLALFYCLRHYEGTPPWSPPREHLKMAMWLLTTMLNIAVFQLLEFWFLTVPQTENSLADLQTHAACADLNDLYPLAVP